MKKQMIACDCGYSVTSPHGEDDLIDSTMAHAKRVHPTMSMFGDQDRKMIKAAWLHLSHIRRNLFPFSLSLSLSLYSAFQHIIRT